MSKLRECALHRGDLAEEQIETPWGGPVLVTEMSAEVRLALVRRSIARQAAQQKGEPFDDQPFVPELLECILAPETREPVFQPEDLPVLLKKNRRTLIEIDQKIADLSASSAEALDEAKKRFFSERESDGSSSSPNAAAEELGSSSPAGVGSAPAS